MIIDGRKQDNRQVPEYDIVVVGGGPAGISVAHEFLGTGLRVALIESGGDDFDADTQVLYDGEVTGL